jgi:hypothetical protein
MIKQLVKHVLSKIGRKLAEYNIYPQGRWRFESDQKYWETRYSNGGLSGEGSIGKIREWKWNVISNYVDVTEKTILDVGCGDISFWKGRTCKSYVGLDFSKTIIERNKILRKNWEFIYSKASSDLQVSAQVVFCFDVLFHVMQETDFHKILENLSKWTEDWLFIYNLRKSLFRRGITDGKHIIYRPLEKVLDYLKPLKLAKMHPYEEENCGLYVFKRAS